MTNRNGICSWRTQAVFGITDLTEAFPVSLNLWRWCGSHDKIAETVMFLAEDYVVLQLYHA